MVTEKGLNGKYMRCGKCDGVGRFGGTVCSLCKGTKIDPDRTVRILVPDNEDSSKPHRRLDKPPRK